MVNPECLRGYEFTKKYVQDYDNLISIGYSKNEAIRALATLQYVQDFAKTPDWLECTKKLPKGYKWSDGTKYGIKHGKKNDAESYKFLMVGEDLYIQNLLNHKYAKVKQADNVDDGAEYEKMRILRRIDKRICIIRDWKKLKATDVIMGLNDIMNCFLEDCIVRFWHENGGRLGYADDV